MSWKQLHAWMISCKLIILQISVLGHLLLISKIEVWKKGMLTGLASQTETQSRMEAFQKAGWIEGPYFCIIFWVHGLPWHARESLINLQLFQVTQWRYLRGDWASQLIAGQVTILKKILPMSYQRFSLIMSRITVVASWSMIQSERVSRHSADSIVSTCFKTNDRKLAG